MYKFRINKKGASMTMNIIIGMVILLIVAAVMLSFFSDRVDTGKKQFDSFDKKIDEDNPLDKIFNSNLPFQGIDLKVDLIKW